MYGLKQAALDWFNFQDKFLISMNFIRSTMDRCLYVYNVDGITCIIYVHIDDYLIGCNNDKFFEDFLSAYSKFTCNKGDVVDLGAPLNHMQIALEYRFEEGVITFSNDRYIRQTLARFGMTDCNPKYSPLPRTYYELSFGQASTCEETFRAIIGCLLWIARTLRADIMFAVVYLAQFVSCCTEEHLFAAKHVLRYLSATLDRHLTYTAAEMRDFIGPELFASKTLSITVKCDSDFAYDSTEHKSYTGYLIYLNGFLVGWITRKQSLVATSTSEAEYIALSEASKASLHLFQLLSEFFSVTTPITVFCDSKSAISMAEKNISSRRTKHIWILYRFVTAWINRGLLKVFYIGTSDNLADFMTKVPKDTNFVDRSNILFKSMTSWLTEVVCYNTEQDQASTLLRVVDSSAGITVCAALKH